MKPYFLFAEKESRQRKTDIKRWDGGGGWECFTQRRRAAKRGREEGEFFDRITGLGEDGGGENGEGAGVFHAKAQRGEEKSFLTGLTRLPRCGAGIMGETRGLRFAGFPLSGPSKNYCQLIF